MLNPMQALMILFCLLLSLFLSVLLFFFSFSLVISSFMSLSLSILLSPHLFFLSCFALCKPAVCGFSILELGLFVLETAIHFSGEGGWTLFLLVNLYSLFSLSLSLGASPLGICLSSAIPTLSVSFSTSILSLSIYLLALSLSLCSGLVSSLAVSLISFWLSLSLTSLPISLESLFSHASMGLSLARSLHLTLYQIHLFLLFSSDLPSYISCMRPRTHPHISLSISQFLLSPSLITPLLSHCPYLWSLRIFFSPFVLLSLSLLLFCTLWGISPSVCFSRALFFQSLYLSMYLSIYIYILFLVFSLSLSLSPLSLTLSRSLWSLSLSLSIWLSLSLPSFSLSLSLSLWLALSLLSLWSPSLSMYIYIYMPILSLSVYIPLSFWLLILSSLALSVSIHVWLAFRSTSVLLLHCKKNVFLSPVVLAFACTSLVTRSLLAQNHNLLASAIASQKSPRLRRHHKRAMSAKTNPISRSRLLMCGFPLCGFPSAYVSNSCTAGHSFLQRRQDLACECDARHRQRRKTVPSPTAALCSPLRRRGRPLQRKGSPKTKRHSSPARLLSRAFFAAIQSSMPHGLAHVSHAPCLCIEHEQFGWLIHYNIVLHTTTLSALLHSLGVLFIVAPFVRARHQRTPPPPQKDKTKQRGGSFSTHSWSLFA